MEKEKVHIQILTQILEYLYISKYDVRMCTNLISIVLDENSLHFVNRHEV